ncbi:MAG: FHA domain-containing protein [Promethearchaeota archaeon]
MNSREDFHKQLNDVRSRIDFEQGTPQKNKTLLQFIKDLCEKASETPDIDSDFKKEIDEALIQVDKDLQRITQVQKSPESLNNLAASNENRSGGVIPPRLIKSALSSVKVPKFDPNSSPILRRLKEQKQNTPSPSPSVQFSEVEPIIPVKKGKKVDKSKLKPKKISKTIKKNISKKTLEPKIEMESPFPKPKALSSSKKIEKNEKKKEIQRKEAKLVIPQLQLTIPLKFTEEVIQIGRGDFDHQNLSINTPPGFFDPIIKKDPSAKATEHCIIEQAKSGKFMIKDRFNLQKTYFNNHFINDQGEKLTNGDVFILPVSIDGQLSSLTVEFHLIS